MPLASFRRCWTPDRIARRATRRTEHPGTTARTMRRSWVPMRIGDCGELRIDLILRLHRKSCERGKAMDIALAGILPMRAADSQVAWSYRRAT